MAALVSTTVLSPDPVYHPSGRPDRANPLTSSEEFVAYPGMHLRLCDGRRNCRGHLPFAYTYRLAGTLPGATGTQQISIIDRREIEFDAKELVRVIAASLHKMESIGLPPIRPVGVRFSVPDNMIQLLYDTGVKPEPMPVSATLLGALLVAYCVRSHIPIPRRADKTIHIHANSAILAFRTEFAAAPGSG